MKKSNLRFENILMFITIALGLGTLLTLTGDIESILYVVFLLWLIPLGIMQLVHSFILVNKYWRHPHVRGYFITYYLGVLVDFILLFVGYNFHQTQSFFWIAVIYLPLSLAFLLWYITYIFKEPALEIIPETNEGEIL